MSALIKAVAVLFSLVCLLVAVVGIKGASDAKNATDKARVERIMEERPELTRAEALRVAARADTGATACCMTGSVGIAGTVWCIGMVPLGILYLLFRPRTPQTIVIQKVQR